MPQKNKYELSIIIPVYNEESYLNKLFEQILYFFNSEDVEVIIVNDGSTDRSKEIIDLYKLKNLEKIPKFIIRDWYKKDFLRPINETYNYKTFQTYKNYQTPIKKT